MEVSPELQADQGWPHPAGLLEGHSEVPNPFQCPGVLARGRGGLGFQGLPLPLSPAPSRQDTSPTLLPRGSDVATPAFVGGQAGRRQAGVANSVTQAAWVTSRLSVSQPQPTVAHGC